MGEGPIVPQLGLRLAQGVVPQAEVFAVPSAFLLGVVMVLAVGQFHRVIPAGTAGGWHLGQLGLTPPSVDIGQCIQRGGGAERLPVGSFHTTDLAGVGIDHQAHGSPGELIGDLEAAAQVRDGAVFADLTGHPVIEQRIESGGQVAQGAYSRQILLLALQRGLSFKGGMGRFVINGFEPGPKTGVEITQIT